MRCLATNTRTRAHSHTHVRTQAAHTQAHPHTPTDPHKPVTHAHARVDALWCGWVGAYVGACVRACVGRGRPGWRHTSVHPLSLFQWCVARAKYDSVGRAARTSFLSLQSCYSERVGVEPSARMPTHTHTHAHTHTHTYTPLPSCTSSLLAIESLCVTRVASMETLFRDLKK